MSRVGPEQLPSEGAALTCGPDVTGMDRSGNLCVYWFDIKTHNIVSVSLS